MRLLHPSFLFALFITCSMQVVAQSTCDHALYFTGNDSYIDCGPGSNFQVEGQLTVTAWVKLDSPSTPYPQYVAGNIDLNTLAGFELAVQNGALQCSIRDTAVGTRSFSVHPVVSGVWTHLAFTYKVGGRFIGYINGNVALDIPASNARIGDNGSTRFIIGGAPWNGDTLNLQGMVDEVRVYNIERSASQIREDMRISLNGPQAGLAGYWKLSEGNGSFTADLSGNGHHGTLSGTAPPVWTPAEGPYGDGVGVLRICAASGPLPFPGTWMELDFPMTSLDTFVVSRINCHPNIMPAGAVNYSDVYWVIDRYGIPTLPSFDMVFSLPSGTVDISDQLVPANLLLFQRHGFSVASWGSVTSASWASALLSSVRFTNPQVTGQLLLGTNGNSVLEIPSVMEEGVDVLCYPNPASTGCLLQLDHPVTQPTPVQLFDSSGRNVFSAIVPTGTDHGFISTSGIGNGVYLLQVQVDHRFLYRRILVLHP